MLKRVLSLIIITVTIITTSTAIGTSAATVQLAEVEAQTKSYTMGDADLDGEVSVMDATEIQRALAGIITLSADQLKTACVNDFDNVYIGDATEVQRYLAGYKCYSCIGEQIEVEVPDDDTDDELDLDAIEAAVEKRFMEYVNEERKAVGVNTLNTNDILMKAAKIRGDELPVSFSHTRPDGTLCYTAIEDQSSFGWLGENVAYNGGHVNFSDPAKREQQIDYLAWKFYDQFKNSPGHYANMIKKEYNCQGVGVAIVISDIYGYECYCAHMFGETWK